MHETKIHETRRYQITIEDSSSDLVMSFSAANKNLILDSNET